MSFDIGDFEKTINELSQGKEGRKLIRRTARHSLEIFNEHTIKNAKSINFKDSRRGWRWNVGRKGAYKYKFTVNNKKFHTWTGINYKKDPILNISHLIERGFKHVASGKFIKGHWFRKRAYDDNKREVFRRFTLGIQKGINTIARTGKAPTLREIRSSVQE